jgi:hypothetical protein
MNHPSPDHPTRPAALTALTRDWTRMSLWLVATTMAYNVTEGAIALWASVHAGSIALVGFGLDSAIECAAAAALLWRLIFEARGPTRKPSSEVSGACTASSAQPLSPWPSMCWDKQAGHW